MVPNVQTETEHFISPKQNRTEHLLLLRQSGETRRRKREGNNEELKEDEDHPNVQTETEQFISRT